MGGFSLGQMQEGQLQAATPEEEAHRLPKSMLSSDVGIDGRLMKSKSRSLFVASVLNASSCFLFNVMSEFVREMFVSLAGLGMSTCRPSVTITAVESGRPGRE